MVELWLLFVFPLAATAYFNLLMSHACVLVGASGETHSCLLHTEYIHSILGCIPQSAGLTPSWT